jgi:hypothetical protein
MMKRWAWLLVLGGLGCQNKGGDANAAASASGSAAPAASGRAKPTALIAADGTCPTELEYLVPPQKHGNADLIRAIVVDGDQVFYRDMHDAFRVPLAGGAPVALGKAPELSLSGTTQLWTSGDKLLTQSPGEPIFMAAAKTGGTWSNMIDLTAAKLGGGRSAATRILQGLGRRDVPRASGAEFDGQNFYFAEVTRGKGKNAPSSSALKSVSLSGGEPRTLYEATGEIGDVTRAGEYVAFSITVPPTPEQLKQNEAEQKGKKYPAPARGENYLMSVPLAGGDAKKLLRIVNLMTGVVLGADGQKLYVSGLRDEDVTKPGIFRVDAAGGGVEELARRMLHGSAFVSGDSVVLVGGGMVEPGKTRYGQLVMTVPRQGKSLELVACVTDKSTLHASAVSGKVALLSLFRSDTSLASIARFALP